MTGLWADRVLPRLVDRALDARSTGGLRARACAGLRGEVLELGFGSGPNLPFYPAAVTGVTAVDPSDGAWRLGRDRIAAATVPVRRADLAALPAGGFDSALTTWTLCTIPDLGAALAELRRVLRPGGELHFLEHGLAPDEPVRRWQRRLDPLQQRFAGGCHLTRATVPLLESAGWTVTAARSLYQRGTPRFSGALTIGVAV